MSLVSKYFPPGGVVLDPFAGTLSVAKACISLNQHRRYICGNIDPACKKYAMSQLVQVFSTQVLNEDSDIECPADVQTAARTLLRRVAEIDSKTLADGWNCPPGCPPVQFSHLIYFNLYRHTKGITPCTSIVVTSRTTSGRPGGVQLSTKWILSYFRHLN